ncbi:MAG: PIG-L family deacetylase [bacterium]|nr:PIG-L family deacetylase [bacterium]
MDHEKILVIVAHPDDIDFVCAGTVARWTREGREVAYCICTSGEKGFTGEGAEKISPGERREIREAEQRAAAAVLGVRDVTFLRQPDGELANTGGLRQEIVRQIRRHRPGLVLTEDPAMNAFDSFYGYHSDHRAVGLAAFESLYPAAGNENYFPELLAEGFAPFVPGEAYFQHGQEQANIWVDISETFELKLQALACHKSQVGDIEELRPKMREWAERNGEKAGFPLAETFRSLEIPR